MISKRDMDIKSIGMDSRFSKASTLILGFCCVFGVLVSTKWLLGNSIASRVDSKEVAQVAVGLAPSDPNPHFALAVMLERSFLPEDLPKSVVEYEKAVALSPNDYRLWLGLGKARERNGDIAGTEKALKRAIELAPNYSQVQWAFGNVLLREGKTEEAFTEIRKAVENDPKFASPAATTAWQMFEGDIEKVKQTIGDSSAVKSALATFLARQKRYDEAYQIWKALPDEGKKTDFKTDGERISAAFLAAKKYKNVLEIQTAISEKGDVNFKLGEVTNPGFETNVRTEKAGTFEWQIGKGLQPQFSISSNEKHEGSQSLAINFRATKKTEFRPISQTVVLDGGRNYRFEIFYKSDLDTSSTVKWEIFDTQSRKVIASTEALDQKTDWKSMSVNFDLPEDSEAVIVRWARAGCKQTICPIKGTVWIDDISIR